ncbi:MAG TPA: hypothetical protein VKF59_07915 [Candidatus Dormibacteraeota bacterium]|nr:hypothetical protein [Candidatus Dormibacteraeota bacterium]
MNEPGALNPLSGPLTIQLLDRVACEFRGGWLTEAWEQVTPVE